MNKINLRELPGKEAQKLLKEVLKYDPLTGDFIWKISEGSRKKGDYAGTLMSTGYVEISIYNNRYLAHRLAWLYMTGEWPKYPKYEVDHIDQVSNNNKFKNLRDATTETQGKNKPLPSNSSSGHIGVSWLGDRKKWKARIYNKHLGHFDNIEDAIQARKDAEIKYDFHENHGKKKKEPLKMKKNEIGISWDEEKQKFKVYLYIGGKNKHIGYFKTEEEAFKARDKAREEVIKTPEKFTQKRKVGARLNQTSGRWQSYIIENKKFKHLGYFNTKEEAYQKRKNYEQKKDPEINQGLF